MRSPGREAGDGGKRVIPVELSGTLPRLLVRCSSIRSKSRTGREKTDSAHTFRPAAGCRDCSLAAGVTLLTPGRVSEIRVLPQFASVKQKKRTRTPVPLSTLKN